MSRKPELKKTYSSYSENAQINRAHETRRDNDTIRTPEITLYDVDYAILDYMRKVIQPQVVENGVRVPVPVNFAHGEKWAQIQKKGYMFDKNEKILTPLISLRRTSLSERDALKKLDVNLGGSLPGEGAHLLHRNNYTQENAYDRYALVTNQKRKREYFISPVPEYVDMSYEMFIWTEYQDQMNEIVEQIMPTGGFAWGTTYKFITYLSDYAFDTVNSVGDERVVRTTVNMTVKGTLLSPYELRRSNLEKRISVKKVTIGERLL